MNVINNSRNIKLIKRIYLSKFNEAVNQILKEQKPREITVTMRGKLYKLNSVTELQKFLEQNHVAWNGICLNIDGKISPFCFTTDGDGCANCGASIMTKSFEMSHIELSTVDEMDPNVTSEEEIAQLVKKYQSTPDL